MSEADNLKKYELTASNVPYYMDEMKEDSYGDWVKFDEAKAVIQSMESEIESLKSRPPTLTDAQRDAVKDSIKRFEMDAKDDLNSFPMASMVTQRFADRIRAAFAGLLGEK